MSPRFQLLRDIVITVLLFVLGGLAVFYYQTKETSVASTSTADVATTTAGPTRDLWQEGPHANTYVVDDNGENSSCARCHAPVNWTPPMDEMPESCTICKFEVEESPPLIPEEDWAAIECRTCHRLDREGAIEAGYIWLEVAAIDEYSEVDSTTELCQRCHTEYDLPGHTSTQVSGAHTDYYCTDCHDAHDTTSSCAAAGCHDTLEAVAAPLAGHDDAHQIVSCVACHDAGGMVVGPSEESGGVWLTYLNGLPDGEEGTAYPYTSHNIQRQVSCDRCHSGDNPWGLSTDVEEGSDS